MIDINRSNSSPNWLTSKSSTSLINKTFSFLAVFDKNKTLTQTASYINCINGDDVESLDNSHFSCLSSMFKSDYEFVFNDQNKTASVASELAIVHSNNSNTKLNCTTPYNNSKRGNLSEKIFMFGEISGVKLNVCSTKGSGDSFDEVKENIGDHFLKRYISRTVTGWDERGMHYWLHKANKPDLHLPLIDDIAKDNRSWYQINFCEKCISRLKIPQDFQRTDEMEHPDKQNKLSICASEENNNEMFDRKESYYDEFPIKYVNLGDNSNADDEIQTQCNEQYVKRLVYCHNTCGLNIKLFNKNERIKQKKRLDEPILNPYIKVVVIGTDPCGLNFPVDLGGVDSKSNNSLVSITSIVSCEFNNDVPEKETIMNDVQSNSKCSSETTTSGTKTISSNEISTHCSVTRINETWTNGYDGFSITSSIQSTASYVSNSLLANSSFETQSSSTSNQRTIEDQKRYQLFAHNLISNFSLRRINNTFKSLSSIINMNAVCSKTGKITRRATSQSVTRKISLSSKRINHKFNQSHRKMVNFSRRDNAFHYKTRLQCAQCNRLHTKNKNRHHVLQFPKSIAKNIKAIYFKNECDKILFSDSTSDKSTIYLKSELLASSQSYFHVILFLTFLLFFVFCYVLILDTMKMSPEPKPSHNSWYPY